MKGRRKLTDKTDIVVILDRSGSMETAAKDHEGGLNSFVQDQRELAGDVRFTLIQFDSENPCEVQYDGVPMEEVQRCRLIPRGGTPLLDAVGKGVTHVRERLIREQRKPDLVICMIITDGEENSSLEFQKATVKSLIERCERDEGWKFLFLGANIDAFAEAGGLGVGRGASMNFANNAVGTESMYASLTSNTLQARRLSAKGAAASVSAQALCYSYAQRAGAMGADAAAVTPEGEQGLTTTIPQPRGLKTTIGGTGPRKGKKIE